MRTLKKIIKTFLTLTCLFSLCLSSLCLAEAVWIDVRTLAEYEENGIESDHNIPLSQIEADGMLSIFNKDDEINLYCRSGRRAETAKSILEAAGYTNITNHGGVDDIRASRVSPK